jgi:hypothetical protein
MSTSDETKKRIEEAFGCKVATNEDGKIVGSIIEGEIHYYNIYDEWVAEEIGKNGEKYFVEYEAYDGKRSAYGLWDTFKLALDNILVFSLARNDVYRIKYHEDTEKRWIVLIYATEPHTAIFNPRNVENIELKRLEQDPDKYIIRTVKENSRFD